MTAAELELKIAERVRELQKLCAITAALAARLKRRLETCPGPGQVFYRPTAQRE